MSGKSGVERLAEIDTQQKGEKQNLRRLQREEELSLDPKEPSGVLPWPDMPAWSGSEGDEEDSGAANRDRVELIAEIEMKRVPTAGQSQSDQGGKQAEAQQRGEAEAGSVAEGDVSRFRCGARERHA